jgi:ABC-type branched-subunit amino acid transport system substrate-binding protein
MKSIESLLALACALGLLTSATVVRPQTQNVSAAEREIKIGQTMPYSGPVSAIGTLGRASAAYFDKINAEGGVNGHKLRLVSLDDGYNPARTVELTRRLVEEEQVLALFFAPGAPTNAAVQKYLNAKGVPQLFVANSASRWSDPKGFPWTMPLMPNYRFEGRSYGSYLRANYPDARVAVLYQNDDSGRDYLVGLTEGLGDRAKRMMVSQASYEVTDPTVDSQVVSLSSSGADVFAIFTTAKFSVLAMRKAWDIGWRPQRVVARIAISTRSVLTSLGGEKTAGLISATFEKDPNDPKWRDDPEYREWLAWMKRYFPDGDTEDPSNVTPYIAAQALVQVLKQCGNDLTRQNLMHQAANLKNVRLAMLLPGVRLNTSASDYYPIKQLRLQRYDGRTWVPLGDMIDDLQPQPSVRALQRENIGKP